MKTSKTFYLGTALAALALGTFVAMYPSAAGAQDMKLKTDLEGGGTMASGNAKWEKRGTGTCNPLTAERCKFSVEGEDFVDGEMVTITSSSPTCVPTALTAQAGTDGATRFDLNLDTDLGNTVGDCVDGDTITVTGPNSGMIVGTLAPD